MRRQMANAEHHIRELEGDRIAVPGGPNAWLLTGSGRPGELARAWPFSFPYDPCKVACCMTFGSRLWRYLQQCTVATAQEQRAAGIVRDSNVERAALQTAQACTQAALLETH